MFSYKRIQRIEIVDELFKKVNKLYSNLVMVSEDGRLSDELVQLINTVDALKINLHKLLKDKNKLDEIEDIDDEYKAKIEKEKGEYEKGKLQLEKCRKELQFFSDWLEEIGLIAYPEPFKIGKYK
jgi:aspartokinase